jgi:hypothetical protein
MKVIFIILLFTFNFSIYSGFKAVIDHRKIKGLPTRLYTVKTTIILIVLLILSMLIMAAIQKG